MKGMVPPDPQTEVSQLEYAVVYVPRRSRKRFAANCVTIKADAKEALQAANPDEKQYAAIVHGPSKSSEGQYVFYLQQWL
jgi:hypothetical protein